MTFTALLTRTVNRLACPLIEHERMSYAACRACKLPIDANHLYCTDCMERPIQPAFGPVCIDCGNVLACVCKGEN